MIGRKYIDNRNLVLDEVVEEVDEEEEVEEVEEMEGNSPDDRSIVIFEFINIFNVYQEI